jgi:chemotaxis signal transduction protein
VDLGALFEGPGAGRRVLVVEAEGRKLGFLVERTLEVADIPEASFRALPALASRLVPGTVRAVAWQEERPVFLLDAESLGPLLKTAAGDA